MTVAEVEEVEELEEVEEVEEVEELLVHPAIVEIQRRSG